MKPTLGSKAAAASEAIRALERAMTASRGQWDDSTRQSFDQRHAESILASGRTVSSELATLAQELEAAFASLG